MSVLYRGNIPRQWNWGEIMDNGNFEKAVESIYWRNRKPIMPNKFKERIITFFQSEGNPMEVVLPCEELKEMVNNVTEIVWEDFYQETKNHVGWCMLKIPVTNNKEEAKKSTQAGL